MTEPARGVNPTALTVSDLAQVLSAAGEHTVTVEMVEADVAAGVPTNPDGTLNVVHFGAWLLRGLEHGFPEVDPPKLPEPGDDDGTGAPDADQMTFNW